MDVEEAVRTMLAVRSYSSQRVPDSLIEEILNAGRLTASSQNNQEWDFVVIEDRDRLRELGDLARSGGYIADAAFAVAVLTGDYGTALADAGRAAQDMMLVAWGQGVGSNWVGNVASDAIREFLNIPGDRQVSVIIPFGYPDRKLGAGLKNRKRLDQVAHLNVYGRPYTS